MGDDHDDAARFILWASKSTREFEVHCDRMGRREPWRVRWTRSDGLMVQGSGPTFRVAHENALEAMRRDLISLGKMEGRQFPRHIGYVAGGADPDADDL